MSDYIKASIELAVCRSVGCSSVFSRWFVWPVHVCNRSLNVLWDWDGLPNYASDKMDQWALEVDVLTPDDWEVALKELFPGYQRIE